MRYRSSGFTLIELIIAIIVLTVLVAIAVPSYLQFRENNILLGAAQSIYSDIQFARSEAIKREGSDIKVHFFSLDGAWCYRVSDNSACSSCTDGVDKCDIHGDEQIRGSTQTSYPNVGLIINTASGGVATIGMSSFRGTMDATDITVRYGSDPTKTIDVQTNALGRVLMCIPTGSTGATGIDSCS